jgi:hypothetical protein
LVTWLPNSRVCSGWRQISVSELASDALVAVEHRGHFGLAARHQHDEARLFGQREMDGVIGGGVAGVQGGDHVDRFRQAGRGGGIGHRQVQEGHAAKAQACCQFFGLAHQLFARVRCHRCAVHLAGLLKNRS